MSSEQGKPPTRPSKEHCMPLLVERKFHTVERTSLEEENVNESETEDIEVIATEENEKYEKEATIGKLSRLSGHSRLWETKLGFYSVLIAYLVTWDSVSQMAFRLEEYGAQFIYLYIFCIIAVAFPLMYLEMSLGQYCSLTVISYFGRIAPGFGGVGFLTLLMNFIYMLMDEKSTVIFGRFFLDSFNILSSDKPYHSCANYNNGDGVCYVKSNPCNGLWGPTIQETSYSKAFPSDGVLIGDICAQRTCLQEVAPQITYNDGMAKYADSPELQYGMYEYHLDDMLQLEYPSFDSLMMIFFVAVLASLVVKRSSKYLVYITFAYQVLQIAVSVSCFYIMFYKYQPKYPHINAFFGSERKPKGRLGYTEWRWGAFTEALVLALSTAKIGQGGLFFLGTHNKFHNNFIWDCAFVSVILIVFPFFWAIVRLLITDSFILQVHKGSVSAFEKNVAAIYENSFMFHSEHDAIVIPLSAKGLSIYNEFEPVMIGLLSFMWFSNAICTKIIRLEIIISSCLEYFTSQNSKEFRALTANIVLYTCGICTLAFYSMYGFHIQADLTYLTMPIMTLVFVLLELSVLVFCYGPIRLFANVTYMLSNSSGEFITTRLLNPILMLLWFIVIPVSAVVSLLNKLVDVPNGRTPYWHFNLGIFVATMSIVPVYLLFQIVYQKKNHMSLADLFKPEPNLWGPRSTSNRKGAEELEKQYRSLW